MTNEQISQDVLHFARLATYSRFYAAVLSVFVGRCRNCGFSLNALATALRRSEQEIGLLLEQPEKWTLDVVSDLMLAMGCEVNPQIREILFAQRPEAQTALKDVQP